MGKSLPKINCFLSKPLIIWKNHACIHLKPCSG
jgi:hypothetical protein